MDNKWDKYIILLWLLISIGCSEDDVETPINPTVNYPTTTIQTCKINEIEFRNQDDQIVAIREFNYNINRSNRMESISIIEDTGTDVLNLRFQFKYRDDIAEVPFRIEEVFGGAIQTSIDFRFDAAGNLTEFTQFQVADATDPPESHIFYYEASELANDSINTRIIIFDIERFTHDWIDVLPAIFTTGGQRITRFDKISFRGDLLEFCLFEYQENGFLEEIRCRNAFGTLTEVWNFTYENERLVSAYRQLPNFRAITEYNYDSDGRPASVVSRTDGRFNWSGRYFYLCR